MSGLLSGKPSPSSVRLAVGGFALMLVQAYLLMRAPGMAAHLRRIVWLVTFVPGASLIGALVDLPDPAPSHWRRRDGR